MNFKYLNLLLAVILSFYLIACGGGSGGDDDPVDPPINQAPTANAGPDQSVTINTNTNLSASASSDPDGDPLTYSWTISSAPAGSQTQLTNPSAVNASITPDMVGDYVIQLVVNDGSVDSASDSITITANSSNQAPTANAGQDQSVTINTDTNLSASASSDPDGDPLTYSWTISSAPAGSQSQLTNPSAVNASITPDMVGDYVIQLVVNDGTVDSASDSITITANSTSNQAPTANAGIDQTVSPTGSKKPNLGTNPMDVNDWTSAHPFVDLMKYSRDWITSCDDAQQTDCTASNSWDTQENSTLDMDENGWIKSLPAPEDAPIFWYVKTIWAIDSHYVGGRHIVLYDGEGTIVYRDGITVISTSPGRDVIDINAENSFLRFDITATDPNKNGNYLKNIRIVREQYENIDLVNSPFNPEYLSSLTNFQILRFMDWMKTNGSIQTNWESRSQVNDVRYTNDNAIPIEILLKLSNELSVTPWVNIPHQADDNYITQFATLALQNLDENLNIYVEYTNEAWNGQFEQADYMLTKGNEEWPNSSVSEFEKALSYFGQRTAQACDIWKNVWGAQKARVHCVMGGQAANSWVGEQALLCPLSSIAPCVNHGIDSLAIAPYFGTGIGLKENETNVQSWSLEQLFTELNSVSIPEALSWIDDNIVVTTQQGIELTAYEGGQHMAGVNGVENNDTITALFLSASRDSRMQASYKTYLDGWKERGGSTFANFNHIDPYSKWGSWGALEYLSQETTPKLQALLDYLNENPMGKSKAVLQGTGADSDGSIASYLWEQTKGQSVTLSGANSARATFDIPSVTVDTALTFKLTVTDNLGETASDEVVVTIQP